MSDMILDLDNDNPEDIAVLVIPPDEDLQAGPSTSRRNFIQKFNNNPRRKPKPPRTPWSNTHSTRTGVFGNEFRFHHNPQPAPPNAQEPNIHEEELQELTLEEALFQNTRFLRPILAARDGSIGSGNNRGGAEEVEEAEAAVDPVPNAMMVRRILPPNLLYKRSDSPFPQASLSLSPAPPPRRDETPVAGPSRHETTIQTPPTLVSRPKPPVLKRPRSSTPSSQWSVPNAALSPRTNTSDRSLPKRAKVDETSEEDNQVSHPPPKPTRNENHPLRLTRAREWRQIILPLSRNRPIFDVDQVRVVFGEIERNKGWMDAAFEQEVRVFACLRDISEIPAGKLLKPEAADLVRRAKVLCKFWDQKHRPSLARRR